MTEIDLLLLLTLIVALMPLMILVVTEIIKWKRIREEFKVWKIMKQELGTSLTPEQFHDFIEKHPKFQNAIHRIAFKMEMVSFTKDVMESLRDILKKMKDDMDG